MIVTIIVIIIILIVVVINDDDNAYISIIITLSQTGLDMIGCDTSAVNKAEQGMRQCLHQLQLLHRVWQHVLPHTVYTKAMSMMFMVTCDD